LARGAAAESRSAYPFDAVDQDASIEASSSKFST
jgi:hypothetical protein